MNNHKLFFILEIISIDFISLILLYTYRLVQELNILTTPLIHRIKLHIAFMFQYIFKGSIVVTGLK